MNKQKQNKKVLYFILFLYELIQTVFIATSRPQTIIPLLPLSWYSTLPLLFIIFILIFNMYFNTKDASFCCFLYRLIKIAMLIGFIAYSHNLLTYSIQNPQFRRQPTMTSITYISLFFIIDVIIIVFLSIHEHNKKINSLVANREKEDLKCK